MCLHVSICESQVITYERYVTNHVLCSELELMFMHMYTGVPKDTKLHTSVTKHKVNACSTVNI